MDKDNGMLWSCMCSLIEILWVFEEKISLNCWQLQHDVPVTEIFEFNPPVNFLYLLSNWVNLLGIFTTCEKPRAFERNPSLWSSYLIPWRPIVYLEWLCWIFFLKFFRNKYGRKCNAMGTSNNDLIYFLSFLKHDKGMNRKLMEFPTTI